MGRQLVYKPGSFYRNCDRTGFPTRAENTKKQWNNIYTRERSFEMRQPQDFVRGRKDDQTVPDPRPKPPPTFLGDITALAQTAVIRSQSIQINPTIPISLGDVLAIMMDNGEVFFTPVVSFGGDFNKDFGPLPLADFSQIGMIFIGAPLPYQASQGNEVVDTDFIAVQAGNFPSSSGNGYSS